MADLYKRKCTFLVSCAFIVNGIALWRQGVQFENYEKESQNVFENIFQLLAYNFSKQFAAFMLRFSDAAIHFF